MVLQYYPMRWGMEGESHWHILGAGLGGGELHGGNVSPLNVFGRDIIR